MRTASADVGSRLRERAAATDVPGEGGNPARQTMNGYRPDVVVIGVGGAGVNTVTRLRDVGLPGARLTAVDASAQVLARAGGMPAVLLDAPRRAWGTGGDMALGAALARSARAALRGAVAGADLVYIVAGLAGGTGGGAAPEIARIARDAGAVTVGFGIQPFPFEARAHAEAAAMAWDALGAACDTTVCLENRRALCVAGDRVPLDVALRVADDVVRQAVHGIGAMLDRHGWIHVDWSTVRRVLAGGGNGCLALGLGRGDRPAATAMRAALASPLADMGALRHARAVLVQVCGGDDLAVADTAAALDDLQSRLAPDCALMAGVALDPSLAGAAQVTVLGTGLPGAAAGATPRVRRRAGITPAASRAEGAPAAMAALVGRDRAAYRVSERLREVV